jgi:hypothetical protein
MENTEKKDYPSRANSRTMSVRIPISDYVDILKESVSQNISLNDWLLLKIYSKNNQLSKGGQVGNIEISYEDVFGNQPLTYLESVKGFFEDDLVNPNDKFTISKEMIFDLINDYTESMKMVHRYQEKEKNKSASLIDVKTQLTILMKSKFKNPKDLDDYREELYQLLNELK